MPATTQTNRIAELHRVLSEGHEKQKCIDDGPVYFISNHLKIYETREERGIGWKPFKLWDKQKLYIEFLEKAYKEFWREIVAKKPRDQGITSATLAWIYYHWLFDKHFHALIGSLKEDKVKLAPGHDTLFAKLRDMIDVTPDYLKPKGFDPKQHQLSMSLINPENGNTILGEIGTENFGRQNRGGVVFRDESAFWPMDTSENTVHTAQLNIDVSTVNGMNHFYYQYTAADAVGHAFTFHYKDNPHFNEEWYEEEKARAARKNKLHIFRREVDMDFRSAVEGQIYPNILKCPRGDYEYNPDWPLICFWDYGFTDMGYLGFLQRDPDTKDLYLIDEVYNSGVTIEWYVPFVPRKVVTSAPYRYLPEEQEKITEHAAWRGKVYHFGDPTGNQRNAATGYSVFDRLKIYSIRPRCGSGWQNMQKRQDEASEAINRLHISNRCVYFYDSFTQFRVPARRENSEATTAQTKGIHKWSHAPSAFEAFAISERLLDAIEENETNPPIDIIRRQSTLRLTEWARPQRGY